MAQGESAEKNPLPHDFFESHGLDDGWSLVRQQVLARLRAENEDLDTLDLLLIERTSQLYATVRQKEDRSEFANDRALKDLTGLLIQMIESLRKQRDKDMALDEARVEIMQTVATAVTEALNTIPAEYRDSVLSTLTELLDA